MWYQKKDPAPITPSQPASSWEDIPDEEYRNLPPAQALQMMGFAPMEEETGPAPPCAGQSIPEEDDAEMQPQADSNEGSVPNEGAEKDEDWELQNAINEVLEPDLR